MKRQSMLRKHTNRTNFLQWGERLCGKMNEVESFRTIRRQVVWESFLSAAMISLQDDTVSTESSHSEDWSCVNATCVWESRSTGTSFPDTETAFAGTLFRLSCLISLQLTIKETSIKGKVIAFCIECVVHCLKASYSRESFDVCSFTDQKNLINI